MRIWTINPTFLDAKGLVALWREGLLAKAVLEGKTKGYRQHPQLQRFYAHQTPLPAICEYLRGVLAESRQRGYKFNATKLPSINRVARIVENQGQLEYEWQHLLKKLRKRDPDLYRQYSKLEPRPHPLFRIVPGDVREWENIAQESE